jgi:type IV secretion system protein VirB9
MRLLLVSLLLTCALVAGDHPAPKNDVVPGPAAAPARSVAYGERDVVLVRARLCYTTLLILPKEEQILDYVCGDKEFWVVNGSCLPRSVRRRTWT